ncbi:MAG: phosphoribosyltransferase [Pedobacter sp.]|nr:phosphoribosyltransferase [Chitinophagaceae bacterium]
MTEKKYILNKEVAAQKLQRMALEIAEQLDGDTTDLIIIGVRNSGMVIAEKVGALLLQYLTSPIKIIWLTLDKQQPKEVILSEPNIDFNGKNIILVDDVANSGRTLLYALKPLLAFHPKRIQTLVLVERMHKLFPIKSDYIGLTIATTLQDHIQVEVENGEVVGAFI